METTIEHELARTLLSAEYNTAFTKKAEPSETAIEYAERYILWLINTPEELADLKEKRGAVVRSKGTAKIVSAGNII